MRGRVGRVFWDRGFGFVLGEDGRDYYLNRSTMSDGVALERLGAGQSVTFDPTSGDKGLRAENVRVS